MRLCKFADNHQFFAAWLIVAIIWLWGTLFVVGFYPIIDGRAQIALVYKALTMPKQKQVASGGSSEFEKTSSTEKDAKVEESKL